MTGRNVHLVGSVPLRDAGEVFETVSAMLARGCAASHPATIPELLRMHAEVASKA